MCSVKYFLHESIKQNPDTRWVESLREAAKQMSPDSSEVNSIEEANFMLIMNSALEEALPIPVPFITILPGYNLAEAIFALAAGSIGVFCISHNQQDTAETMVEEFQRYMENARMLKRLE